MFTSTDFILYVFFYIYWQCFCHTRTSLFCHRTELHASDDGDFTEGGLGWNKMWTGVHGLLQRREVDATYIPITMASSKLDIMDFSVPLIEMRYKYRIFKNSEYCAGIFVH